MADRSGQTAVRAIAFGARAIERALDDITLPQFRVLSLIASSPERASRVAEKAAVSRPSLSGLLDGLEARGWVRRVGIDGDRRGVGLEVTAEGRAVLRVAEGAAADHLARVIDALDPADRDTALAGLEAFGRALALHRAGAP